MKTEPALARRVIELAVALEKAIASMEAMDDELTAEACMDHTGWRQRVIADAKSVSA